MSHRETIPPSRGGSAIGRSQRSSSESDSDASEWLLRVIHVIPAIPACPIRPKSGHSANARVYECTPYGAAVNQDAPPAPGATLLGQHAPGVVSFHLRTSRGRGV